MASFTINIPDDKVAGLINAFAVQYKYQETIDNPETPGETIDNPVGKPAFAKNIIKSFIKEVYIAAQTKAIDETRQTIITDAATAISDVDVE